MSDGLPPALVLYVEDQLLIQQLLQDALEEAGFAVILAANGRDAIEQLEASSSALSALVTDISLPAGPTGWEVARRARELAPALPVVYVTGDSAHEWASQGVPDSLILVKPFVPTQVVVAISTLLNQSTSHT